MGDVSDDSDDSDKLSVSEVLHSLRSRDIRDIKMSPAQTARIVEETLEHEWVSCCSSRRTDSRMLVFVSQLAFGLIILTFCMGMLITADSCEDTQLYSSILTGIIGMFLPAPRGPDPTS